MDLSSYRVAHVCSRCGALYPQEQSPCLRCGAAQVSPLYDYYRMLAVAPGASEGDVRSAYKKLSLKYHPDVNPEGKELFLLISEAYATLKDSARRENYHRLLGAARQGAYTQQRQRPEVFEEDPYEGTPFTFRRVDPAEYERMYREFHRVNRMSQISSRLGAILGGLMGLALAFLSGNAISFGALLVGLILGYFFGRVNPSLAPALLKLMNVVVFAILGLLAFITITGRFYLAIPLLMVFAWVFFGITRRWGRELGAFRSSKQGA